MPVLTLLALLNVGDICTTQNCAVYAETATDLYQIDPVSLTQSHLCTFSGVDGPVNDIAVDDNGTLYALTADELYTVNISNCASTPLASVSSSATFNGLSFLLDGRLIAVDTSGDVTQINPSNGSTSSLGNYGSNLGSSGDAVALSNGQIYATAIDITGQISDDILVTLDPNNGFAATPVGTIQGFQHIYGLGYWAGVLYGFDDQGDVLKIDPSNASAVVAINNSFEWYGAGTTPQAPTQCTSACSAGTYSCDNSGNLLTCTFGSNGCYDWVPSSCGSGQTCSSGACVATCTDACFPFSNQCLNSSTRQSCQIQSNGCFGWNTSSCGANQVCSGGSCGSSCSNQCSSGQTQCSGNDVQSCVADSSGCFHWQTTQTCGGGEFCASGACGTSCNNACTAGQAACNGNIVQTCQAGGGGCTEWQNGQDCGDYGCVGGACCVCMAGDTQCAGDGNVEVCGQDPNAPNGCPDLDRADLHQRRVRERRVPGGLLADERGEQLPGQLELHRDPGRRLLRLRHGGRRLRAGNDVGLGQWRQQQWRERHGQQRQRHGRDGRRNGTRPAQTAPEPTARAARARARGTPSWAPRAARAARAASTGSTAGSTATTGGNKVTASGCGCSETSTGSAGLLALGALVLLARRRTSAR